MRIAVTGAAGRMGKTLIELIHQAEDLSLGAALEQEPIERLVLDVDEDLPLLLPQGTWSLTAFNAAGDIRAAAEITVP